MKDAARLQSCIDILNKIDRSPIPMDNTIRDYMKTRTYIGAKDRADIVERVYRIMRSNARIRWTLQQAGAPETPRARAIADMMLNGGVSGRDMAQHFTGEKHAPDILEGEEIGWIARAGFVDKRQMPEAVRVECPDWAEPMLRQHFGSDFTAQMESFLGGAPLDIRVNTLKGTREEARAMLAAQNVESDPTPYSPFGLRVRGKAFLSVTKAFSKGLVEIQDEGSQLISLLCGAKPGLRVLDYCAGAGGKTLGIAAMMENKGNVVAMDIEERRLEKGRPRFRKAGVHNVELRALSDEQHRKWLRRQKGTMDVVLVDAPCSSSGTWRRNPDLRWRWYGPQLDEIRSMQTEILDKVAEKVKPGGRLVYATCSLFEEENEQQVERFLKDHNEFQVMPLEQAWPEGTMPPVCKGPFMRLTPRDHNTDGFFAAVLTKAS